MENIIEQVQWLMEHMDMEQLLTVLYYANRVYVTSESPAA